MTDIFWHEQKIAQLKNESEDTIKATKQKWRSVDNSFLVDYKDFKPLAEMKYAFEFTTKYDKQWLDYYAAGQVKEVIGCILSAFKIAEIENQSRDSVAETEIGRFIEDCVRYINLKLKEGVK